MKCWKWITYLRSDSIKVVRRVEKLLFSAYDNQQMNHFGLYGFNLPLARIFWNYLGMKKNKFNLQKPLPMRPLSGIMSTSTWIDVLKAYASYLKKITYSNDDCFVAGSLPEELENALNPYGNFFDQPINDWNGGGIHYHNLSLFNKIYRFMYERSWLWAQTTNG